MTIPGTVPGLPVQPDPTQQPVPAPAPEPQQQLPPWLANMPDGPYKQFLARLWGGQSSARPRWGPGAAAGGFTWGGRPGFPAAGGQQPAAGAPAVPAWMSSLGIAPPPRWALGLGLPNLDSPAALRPRRWDDDEQTAHAAGSGSMGAAGGGSVGGSATGGGGGGGSVPASALLSFLGGGFGFRR